MGEWSNYVGSLDIPTIEFVNEECIYVVVDGKKIGMSSMSVAKATADYYAKQGVEVEIDRTIETRGYERIIHGRSGSEYNSDPSEYITTAEAAEKTGLSSSYWRNKCAAGEVPGAYKPGATAKYWLLPLSALER